MPGAISVTKETNRIGSYSEDIREQPVMITFKMEFCSKEALTLSGQFL